jgi:hypothetical protein
MEKFVNPKEEPPFVYAAPETKEEKDKRIKAAKHEVHLKKQEAMTYDPSADPNVDSATDAYRTLFVGRLVSQHSSAVVPLTLSAVRPTPS